MSKEFNPRFSRDESLSVGKETVLARLASYGITDAEFGVGDFFDDRGVWKNGKRLPFSDTIELPGEEIVGSFSACFENIFPIIQEVIDREDNGGFMNAHGYEHAVRTAEFCGRILRLAADLGRNDIGERNIKNGFLAGLTHDLGCLLGRENHSAKTVRMLHLFFGKVNWNDRQYWKVFREAIVDHDIKRVELKDFSFLPPETLVLLIADKIDIGRQRVNHKAGEKERRVLDRDKHTRANYYWENSRLEIEEEEKTALWQMDFSLNINDEEFCGGLCKDNGEKKRKARSSEMIERYKEKDVTYFEQAINDVFETYPERFFTALRGIFGLFPEGAVDKTRVVFNDKEDIGYEKELIFEFERQETDDFVKKYVDLRKKELEGEITNEKELQSRILLIDWIKKQRIINE